jgi:hypothetical protein
VNHRLSAAFTGEQAFEQRLWMSVPTVDAMGAPLRFQDILHLSKERRVNNGLVLAVVELAFIPDFAYTRPPVRERQDDAVE